MNISTVVKEIKKKQIEGKKIVLIHGVFDLFHSGHLYTLKCAKSLGDILVVGVDSNRLVRLLKGKKRPIQSSNERMSILNACKYVDYVFEIDHKHIIRAERKNYFRNLYCKLQPDILASGKRDEWSTFQQNVCEKLGIVFIILGESPGKNSTTSIINKILKRYTIK